MMRAKLKCESILRTQNQEVLTFAAVYGPGNEAWSKFTPAATLSITVTNPQCFGQFEPGQAYMLDFTAAVVTP